MEDKQEISSCIWQKVEEVLSVPEYQREEEDIRNVAQWFRDRSSLFKSLGSESLFGVIRGAKLLRVKADHIIVHQGKIRSSFYVIAKGSCVVYAKKVSSSSVVNPVPFDVTTARGSKERARFGKELVVLRTGRCFGELGVVGRISKCNASVIAEEASVLVTVDKELYSKYVCKHFTIEVAERSAYINMHPLFRGWPFAYRSLLSENLTYRKLKFGERLVRQGNDLENVYFIIEGEVKLTANPIQHTECFPKLLSKIKDKPNICEEEEEEDDECEFHPYETINTMERRKLRQKEGFFASELRYRELDVCTVGSQGIIGDIETIMDLSKYIVTAECIQELSLYEMDKSSFLKIIVKKNPETYEKMRLSVYEKLHYRNSLFEGGLPIYRALLTFFAKPKPKDNRKQILISYRNKKSKEKVVTLNFFVEMSKGRSINFVPKKNRHLQPIRRMIYEATLLREEEAPAIEDQNVENQKNKNTLWKNAGMFAGKFTAMHVKNKRSQETTIPRQFTADDYKELKKKLHVAGKTA